MTIKLLATKLSKNHLFVFFTLFIISSCSVSESTLLSEQSALRVTERQDHQKCVSEGLEVGNWDDLTTELYWRCRYNLAKERITYLPITPGLFRKNSAINKTIDIIIRNIAKAKFASLAKISDDVEILDHEKCSKMGYNLSSFNQSGVDEYYKCRERLILQRIPPAPKITHLYETSVLPEKRERNYLRISRDSRKEINAEASEAIELMKKYPICVGLSTDSLDFKKCSEATESSKECLSNIESMKVKKRLEDKIYCQKQAFIQFPDNYALAKDKSASEIAKLEEEKQNNEEENYTLKYLEGETSDISNLGRQVNKSDNEEERSKEKIYSKLDLLRLREQFMYQCNQTMDEKLPDFVENSTKTCLDIANNWDK